MSDAPQTRAPAGAAVLRPEKTDAIVSAFFAELAEHGYRGLTMDAVAARAGVGKAALYRRWRSKDEMLVELVSRRGAEIVLPPDRGTLRDDLLEFIEEAIAQISDPVVRRVMTDVVAESHVSPALAEALAASWRDPRRDAGRAMLRRAVERGELAADVDVELALDLIAGPIYLRGAVLGEPFPAGWGERLAGAVLGALEYRVQPR